MSRSMATRMTLSALLLFGLAEGCSSNETPKSQPTETASRTAVPRLAHPDKGNHAQNCRHFRFDREDRTPPDPTVRSCTCIHAQTLRTSAEIKNAGKYYLSSRDWNDAYVCAGSLHLVYGNVHVTFEDASGISNRAKAVRFASGMARQWGGQATEMFGYPSYKQEPHISKGSVGEVLIVVNGVMIQMIGNRAASLDDIVTLANTFQI